MVTKNLEKSKVLHIIYDFFNQFSTWCGHPPLIPSLEELEKYISTNLHMYNNGQMIAKNSADYLERIKNLQKKYSSFQISEPLEEPLINGNKAAIYYKLDLLTHLGQHKQIYIIGLVTIEKDKISHWTEVTNEKSGGTWDIGAR